jgi:hypothetical protein
MKLKALALTFVALLLGWASTAQAAVAVVQSKTATSATPFDTDGIDALTFDSGAPVGSLIVVGFAVPTAARTVTTVSDGTNNLVLCSQGGTNATASEAALSEVWLYCGIATATVNTVTVTLSGAVASNSLFFIAEFSGHDANSWPIEDAVVANTASGTTHSSGNLVTASAGSALVGIAFGTTGSYTNDADFTALDVDATLGVSGYDLVGAATSTYAVTTAAGETTSMAAIAITPSMPAAAGTFMQTAEDLTDSTSYSFASQNFGAADADRWIIVIVVGRKSGTATCNGPTSMTIGGVSAGQVVDRGRAVSNCNTAAIWRANVPTGTTGTIAYTYAGTQLLSSIAVYRTVGTQSDQDSSSGTADDPTNSITIPAGGFGVGGSVTQVSGATATWTGLTETHDTPFAAASSVNYTGALLTPGTLQTSLSILVDWTASGESVGVFAAWDVEEGAPSGGTTPSLTLRGVGDN